MYLQILNQFFTTIINEKYRMISLELQIHYKYGPCIFSRAGLCGGVGVGFFFFFKAIHYITMMTRTQEKAAGGGRT